MTTLADIVQFVRNQIDAPRIIREQTALLNKATTIIVQQQQDIEELERKQQDINAVKLDHMREMQGMAVAWLLNMEKPEIDLRDAISQIERTYAESIAQIEEHIL